MKLTESDMRFLFTQSPAPLEKLEDVSGKRGGRWEDGASGERGGLCIDHALVEKINS